MGESHLIFLTPSFLCEKMERSMPDEYVWIGNESPSYADLCLVTAPQLLELSCALGLFVNVRFVRHLALMEISLAVLQVVGNLREGPIHSKVLQDLFDSVWVVLGE